MQENNSESANNNVETNVRKRPGRPRKKPIKKPMVRKGISVTPLNSTNCIELIYDDPLTFKKICNLFKSSKSKTIMFKFVKDCLQIYAMDHGEKSNIQTMIHGEKVNHYYCNEELTLYIKPDNLWNVMSVLDKNYNSMAIIIESSTKRSKVTMVYKNSIGIDEVRVIDQIRPTNKISTEISFDVSEYPISFELPSKYFKKLMNDYTGSGSNVWTIEKVGNSNLSFAHTNYDNTVKGRHIIKEESKIKLVSKVAEGDIFSSSIYVDYVKPFSNSLLSEYIQIHADSKKNIIFKLDIDNKTIQVKINTKTVVLR